MKRAVRQVLFHTGLEDYTYSCAGSMFVVVFQGRCYGLTCKHVIGVGGVDYLFVAPEQAPEKGVRPASVGGVALIGDFDSDLQEIAIIWFSDEIGPEFFGGTAYTIGPDTVGPSSTGNSLKVHGFLNEKSRVDYEAKSITGGCCDLQFHNVGATSSDPFIRQALATYVGHNFSSLDGISGAPVFDETEGRLCGMVVRAGLNELGGSVIWYIEVSHVIQVLEAVHAGSSRLNYLLYPGQ